MDHDIFNGMRNVLGENLTTYVILPKCSPIFKKKYYKSFMSTSKGKQSRIMKYSIKSKR